eukprot:3050270-Rhodomonas_salina.1
MIVHTDGALQSDSVVSIQISTPHHRGDTAPKFAEFATQHVCNGTKSSVELTCTAMVDCRAIDLKHGFETVVTLSLKDRRGTLLSEHEMSIWIRSTLAPPALEPPDCWRTEHPLHLQDPDCVWLWLTLKPSQNVFLSLQDFGPPEPPLTTVLGGAASLHAGTWAHLINDFGGISPASPELLSCLPAVGYVRREHASCAVVGSAWHLDHSNFGPEIDAHEVVLRINDAPLAGWEAHVGSKTTHRMLNEQVPWQSFDAAETLLFRLRGRASVPRFEQACRGMRSQPVFALSPSFIEYVHAAFAGVVERSQAFVHTTGFLAAIWALHACKRVAVYGLGGGASELVQGMVQYNYFEWTESNPNYFAPLHAWDDEAVVLARLEQAGALRRRFRAEEEIALRCAVLGETSVRHGAAPHNVLAHARLCANVRRGEEEDEEDEEDDERKSAAEKELEGAARRSEAGREETRDSKRADAQHRGAGSAPAVAKNNGTQLGLYDSEYAPGGQYAGAHLEVLGQAALWNDLMGFPGPGPLFELEGGRAAAVLDAGAAKGAVVQWLRHGQQ